MEDTWCVRQRQEWIAEMLRIYGFINRKHIERKFEVSHQQASADLKTFQERHPGLIEYHISRKRFEPAGNRADESRATD
jgi:hypothetical protein